MAMTRDDAEEYTQSLGQIVAGSWRQIALAKRLGVPKALSLTTERWVNDRLGGYVKLSISERREAVAALAADGHSNVAIGEVLGVNEGTVRNDRSEISETTDEKTNDNIATEIETSEFSEVAPIDAVAALAADEKIRKTATRQEDKKVRRAAREAELGKAQVTGNLALPDKSQYGVILADPEWRFEPWSRETGMDRAADNHYPTSVMEVIAARPVEKIAAKDCILFLWATVPMLPHSLTVMAAWGFDYKSHIIWSKDRIGTGYWFRNKHELLLVGTRGNIPAPAMGTQWFSVMMSACGEHSQKPDWQYELIEAYFPTLTKIELNARRRRAGWDAWGLDAPIAEAAE